MEKKFYIYDSSGNPSDISYSVDEILQKNLPADTFVCPEGGNPGRISEFEELSGWKPPKIKLNEKEIIIVKEKSNGSGGWGVFMLILFLFILAITNPKQEDFQNEITNKYGLNFSLNKDYKNLIVFSIYKSNNTSFDGVFKDRTFIGILGQVVELE
jgi:hypothetical protein